jgi:hypothetical protein
VFEEEKEKSSKCGPPLIKSITRPMKEMTEQQDQELIENNLTKKSTPKSCYEEAYRSAFGCGLIDGITNITEDE